VSYGAVVSLVSQRISTAVTKTQMSTGQDECVPNVRHADDALVSVVFKLIIIILLQVQENIGINYQKISKLHPSVLELEEYN